ncbi:MAG: hypothetical protein J5855_07555 [Mailhella sp.]|nr:hypothetical protein [Mailhella sp.]
MQRRVFNILAGLSLVLSMTAGVSAALAAAVPAPEGSAVAKSPAKNAAVVAKLAGLVNNRHEKTFLGKDCAINDGIVIRQSYIKDGKIIIPVEGLYTTARTGNFYPFDNEPITMAGKLYRVIVHRYERDIVRDVKMKKGDYIPVNTAKSRGWELSSFEGWATYGFNDAYGAVFKVVKTTGNYYGSTFPVKFGSAITNDAADGGLINGSKLAAGIYVPDEENGLSRFDYGANVATVGRSHVVVDHADPDGTVYVKELATDSLTDLFISPTEPVRGTYAEGDEFAIGDAKVKVGKISGESVDIAITSKSGEVTRKTVFIDSKNGKWLVQSMVELDKCYLVSKDGSTLVHLDIRPGNAFHDGKVNLVAYTDVFDVQDGNDWRTDPRFRVRPEG